MNNIELEEYLADYLETNSIKDYCPNGLQVEGRSEIKKIVTGVTASQKLIRRAIELNADAIIVHHGIFWKGDEQPIRGMLYKRVKELIENGINLYAYHLPLDAHKICGNNVLLAKEFDAKIISWCDNFERFPMVPLAELSSAKTLGQLVDFINLKFNRNSFYVGDENQIVKKIAWCSGSASEFLDLAVKSNADAFITGEFPERVVHEAEENGIAIIAAGHHATEIVGIKMLGEHISEKFNIECEFINLPNQL